VIAVDGSAPAAAMVDGLPGVEDVGPLGLGGLPSARTTPAALVSALTTLRDERGFKDLTLLTAVDTPADAGGGVWMFYGLTRRKDHTTVIVTVPLAEDSLRVPTLAGLWSGAEPLEREVYDLFGVDFEGHPDLKRIVLRDDFVGHPLRKSYEMNAEGVTRERVDEALKSHGDVIPTFTPDAEGHIEVPVSEGAPSPFAEAALLGDPVLHSDRMVLNMGPQHPSMHGVVHLWLALEGEMVQGAEVTQGYLHRCIEKLCESRSYRACIAMMDRSDYVSGFHTELAYLLALEELAEIEVPARAQYLRVIFSELCRITSHHAWITAAGMDTGALMPFFPAFADRERILDVYEAVTGGRMMFNYFRPGGVKDDMPPGAVEMIRDIAGTFGERVDLYESLLTDNEIFRNRTRGVGCISVGEIRDHCVTGPMARASGVDADLRRDEPYAAYGDLTVNVPLGTAGDCFDRYSVRIAEMRESARLVMDALDRLPDGPYVNPDVPRAIRPPAGTAYRRIESPRGELGVLLVSDGTAQPWRLKIRTPAMSNLHCAPSVLEGCRLGDVVAIMGSVDVVMGEIDR
jgi:NADH:ubiquinone oxidoreductase subunit D/NADH:ubiquinone oxidoreductase subunit C